MSEKKSSSGRKSNGQFESGTTVGSETRFVKFNKAATKYKARYADMLLQFFHNTVEYPTFEAFAGEIGVTTETLRNWCKDSARFSACYERAKEIQRARLITGALSGRYDSSFAKFFAQNCLDMVKKPEEEQGEKKPFDVNINIIPNPGADKVQSAECRVQSETTHNSALQAKRELTQHSNDGRNENDG